jgi:hypothetical protein
MTVDANVGQTVAHLRGLLPLDLYVTLGQGRGGHPLAAKARLIDVVDEDAAGDRAGGHRYKNRVGVRVQYNGRVHRTLCSAGKDMRKSLREELYHQDTGVITFDSWHRTKVCLNGQIYRMKELIPPAVRRGSIALTSTTFLRGVPEERRDHHLHQVLRAGQAPTVVDGTTAPASADSPTPKRRRVGPRPPSGQITVVSPVKLEAVDPPQQMTVVPAVLISAETAQAPMNARQIALIEQSMTMLRETFPAIDTAPKMLLHIQGMASEQLALLGVPFMIRATLCAKN